MSSQIEARKYGFSWTHRNSTPTTQLSDEGYPKSCVVGVKLSSIVETLLLPETCWRTIPADSTAKHYSRSNLTYTPSTLYTSTVSLDDISLIFLAHILEIKYIFRWRLNIWRLTLSFKWLLKWFHNIKVHYYNIIFWCCMVFFIFLGINIWEFRTLYVFNLFLNKLSILGWDKLL